MLPTAHERVRALGDAVDGHVRVLRPDGEIRVVRHLSSYAPTAGDECIALTSDRDVLVIDRVLQV